MEDKYPVDTWKINDVHIWPIIRTQLFLHLVEKIEPYSKSKSANNPTIQLSSNPLIKRIQTSGRFKKYQAKKILNKLHNVDLLFSSASIYRSTFKGESYDKFADPILDQVNRSGVIVEHSPSHLFNKEIAHKKERVFYLTDAMDYILKSSERKERIQKEKRFQLELWERFINELKEIEIVQSYLPKLEEKELDKLINRFEDFKAMYAEILNRTQPKLVFSICYYSFPVFALNHVAKSMGIKTIEIQHGPQTTEHLAYASWSKVPKEGFNTMPEVYWNWDEHSNNIIDQWTSKTKSHRNIVGGNPWINFHRNAQGENQNIILYSLQNQTLEHLFPDEVVDAIKNVKGYEWWLRLHPRQTESRAEFEIFLKEKGILDLVNFIEATQLPLPTVLNKSKLHITNFSGCTLEASEFGIPTILIEERGLNAFKELVEEEKAFYCSDLKDLTLMIQKLLSTEKKEVVQKNFNYSEILDQL